MFRMISPLTFTTERAVKQTHSKPALTASRQLLAGNSLGQRERLQQPKRDHYPKKQQPKRDHYPKKLLESPVLKQGGGQSE